MLLTWRKETTNQSILFSLSFSFSLSLSPSLSMYFRLVKNLYMYSYIFYINHFTSIIRMEASICSSTLSPPRVIDCRSLSTPTILTSVPLGGATHLCTHCCSPPSLTVTSAKTYILIFSIYSYTNRSGDELTNIYSKTSLTDHLYRSSSSLHRSHYLGPKR